MIKIILYLFFTLQFTSCFSFNTKPNLTFDEFFDYTVYPSISFSPTSENLLIQTRHPSWINNTYVYTLWIYNIKTEKKTLITNKLHPAIRPKWSPSGNWIVLSLKTEILPSNQSEQKIYLYSIVSNELLPIQIGKETPLDYTWSNNDYSLYIVTSNSLSTNSDEWKDVIQYRKDQLNENYTLYKIDFNQNNIFQSIKQNFLRNISFAIGELLRGIQK